MDIPYISGREVLERIEMPKLIAEVGRALASLSRGEVIAPPRQVTPYLHDNTHLNMSVYYPRMDGWVTKLVTVVPGNPAQGRPLIHATIVVQKGATGEPIAFVDGSVITGLRTAAASAVATDLLAPKRVKTLAIFGTGTQAETHLRAMCSVRDFTTVMVFGSSTEKAKAFCDRLQAAYPQLILIPSHDFSKLREAEVICTCTTSNEPLFTRDQIAESVHINAVGAFQPDSRELSSDIIEAARVVVDHIEGCQQEAGDLLIPLAEGRFSWDRATEIGHLVNQGAKHNSRITVYKSVGHGVLDAAAIATLLEEI